MKILFFDCETNGLPIDYKASYEDVNNWPRVISLAWILTDDKGNIISKYSELTYPNGWEMPTEEFWINHGYTQERSLKDGIAIENILDVFMSAKMQADLLVGHNLNFDHRIVWAEFIRNGKQPRSGMNKYCTMMKSTSLCKLPKSKGGGYKWPSLIELHQFLFNKKFDGAHDALADVTATKDCFFKMVEMQFINLSDYEPVVNDLPFD